MYTVSVIMLVMWLLGMSSSYDFGGFLHVFLFVAAQTISDYVAYRDIFHAGEASDPAESAVT